MKHFLLATLTLATTASVLHAETAQQLDAHEHGAATLRIAQQAQNLVIELDTPAFNLIGFEHAPSNESQQKTLDDALSKLNDGETAFQFPNAAQCRLVEVNVESSLISPHASEDEHEHDDEHEDEHDAVHSDFEVFWQFSCREPAKLANINVSLFASFEALADLDVDFITDTDQGSVELSPTNTVISFK